MNMPLLMTENPILKHPTLTHGEMSMICDVSNPGFKWERESFPANWANYIACSIRANVSDSFELYPGTYEEKWGVDRDAMLLKLARMSDDELEKVADQVDAFWAGV